MQLVVPSAVRNAVSAATRTFTANSMIFCFFIRFFVFFSVVRWCGGQPLLRLEARDYSAAESSALRVTSSPPELGGEPVRAGWSEPPHHSLNYSLVQTTPYPPSLELCSLATKGTQELRRGRDYPVGRKTPYLDYSRTPAPPKLIHFRLRRRKPQAAGWCRRSPRTPRPLPGSWQ